MDNNATLATHETMELHEMIKSSVIEIKVLQQYYPIARELKTKTFINDCINVKQKQLFDLEQFIKAQGIIQ